MRNKVLFGLILLVFLVTRIYKIGTIPSSVYWDEASIGYNAYSVMLTGQDEWGEKFPVHFRAFGEFKLPVYIYSVIPFIKLFGLTEFAVRFPAVIYSLGSLVFIYFLAKKITGRESIGILSAFILSITPWLFIFSRTGYEATAGLFFFLAGTYLFLISEKNRLFLILGSFGFILSFYSYNSFRIIIPVWLLGLFVYTFRKSNIKILTFSILIFLVSLVPVYKLYRYDSGGSRFAQVKITKKDDFIKNYLTHFSPSFLFLNGDTNPRSQVPGQGQIYLAEIPFLILGLIALIKSKKALRYLPLIALILAPIPAALTRESPHALRAILAAPALAIISAVGIYSFGIYFKRYSKVALIGVVLIYLLTFGAYFKNFISTYPAQSSSDWQYEYKEIFANQKEGIVTDKYAQPYIFALFYLKYPPDKFKQTVKYNPVDRWGFSLVSSFNGFEFK